MAIVSMKGFSFAQGGGNGNQGGTSDRIYHLNELREKFAEQRRRNVVLNYMRNDGKGNRWVLYKKSGDDLALAEGDTPREGVIDVAESSATNFKNYINSDKVTVLRIPVLPNALNSNLNSMFQGFGSLKSVEGMSEWSLPINSMVYFAMDSAIEDIDLRNVLFSSSTNFGQAFFRAKAKRIAMNVDFSESPNVYAMFTGCNDLTTIEGEWKGIKINLNLSDSPLTRESALVPINGLYDYAAEGDTATHFLYFKSTTKALLTDADKAIAVKRGWSIA